MLNDPQIEANRHNARHSTGPLTAGDKEKVRLTVLNHGAYARRAVLPIEDPAEFEDLRAELEYELVPVGRREQALFDEIVLNLWRLERSRIIADALVHLRCLRAERRVNGRYDPDDPFLRVALAHDNRLSPLDAAGRAEGRFRRAYYNALAELERRQELRRKREKERLEKG